MRFLHLSDLHLGKRLCEFSMLEEQRYILEEILTLLDETPVDGVLLAGDLYDKPVPPAEAVRLLDWFLTELAHRNIPVLAIAGNHDSAERLDYAAGLLSSQQVYLAGQFTSAPRRVILQDEFGGLTFDLLPFVRPATVRHCLPDKSKNALREISILGLRGDAPIKEASVTIGDTELKLAVVNGLANAKKLLKEIDEGKKFYHLIEVMTCQGGCVGGAGQPYGLKKSKEKRGDGLHLSDNAAMFKRAERNPVVAQMMAEYGEERCHELLHVSYTNK